MSKRTDNITHFKAITTEMLNIYDKKNRDYGNSFDKTLDEDGLLVSKIRLQDKFQRFSQLIKSEAQVKDESIRDTLVDMANYAIMTVMWMDNEAEKEEIKKHLEDNFSKIPAAAKGEPLTQERLRKIMENAGMIKKTEPVSIGEGLEALKNNVNSMATTYAKTVGCPNNDELDAMIYAVEAAATAGEKFISTGGADMDGNYIITTNPVRTHISKTLNELVNMEVDGVKGTVIKADTHPTVKPFVLEELS